MATDEVAFVRKHNRAVLVTHRRDGGLQASPVRVLVNEKGQIVATTRATTAKARNLGRDSRFALCVMNDDWLGKWLTLEGTAELRMLPEALDELRSFFILRDGEVEDEKEFEKKVSDDQRVLIRFSIERSAGTAMIP